MRPHAAALPSPRMQAAPAGPSGRPALAAPPQERPAVRVHAQGPADPSPDLDVAVFRFTLGIPGIDDSLVPRIVGALGAAGLAANHLLGGGGPASASQDRAEALGAGLAAACIVTPSVEARLKEAAPGRGRGAAASLAGAAPVFAVAGGNAPPAPDAPAAPPVAGGAPAAAAPPSDPPPLAAELAWASYALLRNTNAASVAVAVRRSEEGGGGGWEGLLARGSFPAAAAGGPLAAVGRGAAALAAEPSLAGAFGGRDPAPAWLPDRGGGLGGPAWAGLAPPGAGCALVCPLLAAPPPLASSPSSAAAAVVRGVLILVGDRPRGLSPRDRAWARAVAAKIGAAL